MAGIARAGAPTMDQSYFLRIGGGSENESTSILLAGKGLLDFTIDNPSREQRWTGQKSFSKWDKLEKQTWYDWTHLKYSWNHSTKQETTMGASGWCFFFDLEASLWGYGFRLFRSADSHIWPFHLLALAPNRTRSVVRQWWCCRGCDRLLEWAVVRRTAYLLSWCSHETGPFATVCLRNVREERLRPLLGALSPYNSSANCAAVGRYTPWYG